MSHLNYNCPYRGFYMSIFPTVSYYIKPEAQLKKNGSRLNATLNIL